MLSDAMTGDARWDVRLTAWLLWVAKQHTPPQDLAAPSASSPPATAWQQFLSLLPPEHKMSLLLNFRPQEAEELQIPSLQVSLRVAVAPGPVRYAVSL